MSTTPTRVYVARLVGLPIFDPQGDQVGKVRDLVVALRSETSQPRVLGLVAEVFGRRRIFVPMTRVTNVDSGQVYTTGLLNMRRFEQRPTETLVIGQMLDRTVTDPEHAASSARSTTWRWSRPATATGCCRGSPSRSRPRASAGAARPTSSSGATSTGLTGREETQGATHLIAALNEMRPADAANMIHDLPPERRTAVVAALDDERLADVLEELPEEDQVEILELLDSERAADILEEMSPDDAADLIADLPPETAATLLGLMEPDEAEDVRRLMSYAENTAGAMMTPEPVILGPDATIADALAHVRNPELTPVAGRAGLRLPPAARDADRQVPRRRPHPAAAARAAVDAGRRRPRRLHGPAAPRGHDRRGRRPPGDVQPGRGARRRRRTGTCSAPSPSTTCSTTCCPRTGVTAPRSGTDRPQEVAG